jgi:hypothetical protein
MICITLFAFIATRRAIINMRHSAIKFIKFELGVAFHVPRARKKYIFSNRRRDQKKKFAKKDKTFLSRCFYYIYISTFTVFNPRQINIFLHLQPKTCPSQKTLLVNFLNCIGLQIKEGKKIKASR